MQSVLRPVFAIVTLVFGTVVFNPAAGAEHSSKLTPASPPAGFKSETTDVGDVKMHYVIGGQGPAVLLIHGWPETWYGWRKVMPLLAAEHTVVAVDYRGAGDSSAPDSGYDRKTMAEDIYKLMIKIGHARATVVGHDWGATIAYAYAAAHRDAVDKLVVMDGAPDGPWTENKEPYWFFGFQGIPDFAEKVVGGREVAYLDWFYRNKQLHVVRFDEAAIVEYDRCFTRPGRMKAGFELYRTIDQDIRDNAEFALTPLSIPVLAVGARHGVGAGVAEAMRHVASNVIPVLMEDTGHFMPEERPDAVAGLIKSFMSNQQVQPAWSAASQHASH